EAQRSFKTAITGQQHYCHYPARTLPMSSPNNRNTEKPRLSEQEKKNNHIASEQKRRQAIRDGFDRLASIVPGMEGQGRSEAVVLEATLPLMREKIEERQQIIHDAQAKGVDTTGWELTKETVQACQEQPNRIRDETAYE